MTHPKPVLLSANAARIEQGPGIPAWAVARSLDATDLAAPPEEQDDERLVAYTVTARPAYDGLRRAAAQLAGVLVLAAIGGRSGQDHPMIRLADDTYHEAADAVAALVPPPGAAHHHRHLAAASGCLGEAFVLLASRLHGAQTDLDALNRPVRSAIDHLRWAGQLLSGFEIVDFSQGCACHPGIFDRTNKTARRVAR